jgi:DNA-binding MarR family transcriptional regulator
VTNYSGRTFQEEVRAVEVLYPAVYRRFHRVGNPLPGLEITVRMGGVLQLLAGEGPLTLGEIASGLDLGKATVSELVDRMETRGLVARMRDDRDRRRVFLGLTDAGHQAVLSLGEVLEDSSLRDAMDRMSPDDRTSLIRGLEALLRAAQEVPHG